MKENASKVKVMLETKIQLASNPKTDQQILSLLAKDNTFVTEYKGMPVNRTVSSFVAGNYSASAELLGELAHSSEESVLREVVMNFNSPRDLVKSLSSKFPIAETVLKIKANALNSSLNNYEHFRGLAFFSFFVSRNEQDIDRLSDYCKSDNPWSRYGVARNPVSSIEILDGLKKDDNQEVSYAARSTYYKKTLVENQSFENVVRSCGLYPSRIVYNTLFSELLDRDIDISFSFQGEVYDKLSLSNDEEDILLEGSGCSRFVDIKNSEQMFRILKSIVDKDLSQDLFHRVEVASVSLYERISESIQRYLDSSGDESSQRVFIDELRKLNNLSDEQITDVFVETEVNRQERVVAKKLEEEAFARRLHYASMHSRQFD